MTLTTVVIHWTGPHSFWQVSQSENGDGIYLLVGKQKYERQEQIQYCGITQRQFRDRINGKHPALTKIKRDTLSIWLGEVVYPTQFDRSHLEIAESCLVSFWQPSLNELKRAYCPVRPICLVSQWFNRDGRPRLSRPPILRDLPDILWWDQERWRTGKLKVGPKID